MYIALNQADSSGVLCHFCGEGDQRVLATNSHTLLCHSTSMLDQS